jgi:hypothetical protein
MNDTTWERMRQVLNVKRAVSREVASERPYIPYDKNDTATVYADDRFTVIPPEQRGPVYTKAVNLSSGIIITKHPVPGEPPILPQLRPDERVLMRELDRQGHSHDAHSWITRWGDENKTRAIATKALELHLASDKHDDAKPGEGPVDIGDGKHVHHWDGYAKYLLAPTPVVTRMGALRPHDARTTNAHVQRRHDGTPTDAPHRHPYKAKDRRVSYEKRLDMHPRAARMLPSAERVFFSIEGSIKADALLSKGECSFAVPSVTMWAAPELERFTRRHLKASRYTSCPTPTGPGTG